MLPTFNTSPLLQLGSSAGPEVEARAVVVETLRATGLGAVTRRNRRDVTVRYKRSNDPAEIIKASARWFSRFYHPYLLVDSVFIYGLAYETQSIGSLFPDPVLTTQEHQILEKAYFAIRDSIPGFRTVLNKIYDSVQVDMLQSAIRLYGAVASQARSEDVSSLKKLGMSYLEPDVPLTERAIDPIRFESRAARGFNSVIFARLLCPHRLLADFDKDPDGFIATVQNGQLEIKESDYPYLYYDGPYDKTDIGKGLLRSRSLVLVFKHIYTSPSSTLSSGKKTGSKGQAGLHGITFATGRMIAYAALQLRHMCTSNATWANESQGFNNKALFDNLIELFEYDPTDTWVIETLAWWNVQVFGAKPLASRNRHSPSEDDENESDHARFLAQRLQARLAASQAGSSEASISTADK